MKPQPVPVAAEGRKWLVLFASEETGELTFAETDELDRKRGRRLVLLEVLHSCRKETVSERDRRAQRETHCRVRTGVDAPDGGLKVVASVSSPSERRKEGKVCALP
jgi:hypothetical protein